MHKTNNLKIGTLLVALTLAAGSLQAYAIGTADDTQHNVYISSFKKLDMNNDGMLSKTEAGKEDLFAEHFSAADIDKNGKLDQAEYTEYRSQVEKKNLKRVLSDTEITAKIKAKLVKDAGVKSLKIDVETYKGVVLLSGFVETPQQIKQAENIAKSVEGVESVKNSLILKKK
ncbi:MAG TPA: BON domain-containing protein [Methylophilaceae bacterium]|nr:BON domain-containing protein [Methylophilaceae bacterium]